MDAVIRAALSTEQVTFKVVLQLIVPVTALA